MSNTAPRPPCGPATADPPLGVVLPSLRWTTDRPEVHREHARLFAWHARLDALLKDAGESGRDCSWYALALAARDQLDCDIDRLFDWLEATGPEDGTAP